MQSVKLSCLSLQMTPRNLADFLETITAYPKLMLKCMMRQWRHPEQGQGELCVIGIAIIRKVVWANYGAQGCGINRRPRTEPWSTPMARQWKLDTCQDTLKDCPGPEPSEDCTRNAQLRQCRQVVYSFEGCRQSRIRKFQSRLGWKKFSG